MRLHTHRFERDTGGCILFLDTCEPVLVNVIFKVEVPQNVAEK
jgi:hypothetical protein